MAYSGTHSLALHLSGPGYTAIQTSNVSGVGPGAQIVYHVYTPGNVAVVVQPYVQDWSYRENFVGGSTSLYRAAGWITVTAIIPSGTQVRAIGLQVGGLAGTPTIEVDDLLWP